MKTIFNWIDTLLPGVTMLHLGGGSSTTPQATTTTSAGLPSYAQPYMENLLGQGAALTNINANPYQQYPGQQVAAQTPLQEQANQNVAGMGVSPQIGAATNTAQNAVTGAQNFQYNPAQYQSIGIGALGVNAPSLQNYQMTQPGNVSTGQFTDPNVAAQYMNPFFRNVVDFQSQEAARQAAIQKNQIDAQAVAAGGYGGSRGALMQSELLRNLAIQQGGIAATGAQNAYQAAQQAYLADQARALQAAQGNQQIGYQTGAQNLAANLGVQQLGAGQTLQAQQLNQAAGLQAQQQALAQSQAANQQALANAQNAAQFGLAGIGQQLQGAQTLGGLGAQQNQQQLAINQQQAQLGAAQQQAQQNQLTAQYQDFLNNLNYPYKQLGFMQGLLQGQPTSQTQSIYQAAPSPVSTLTSLGLGAAGIASLLGKLKKGGQVKKMAVGGLSSLIPAAQAQPNPYLQASMQNQNAVPPYIAAPILQNRGQLNTAVQGQLPPQPVNAMPARMVAPPPQQPQVPLDKGLAQLQADPTRGMADGGVVGYADGGVMEGIENFLVPPTDPMNTPDPYTMQHMLSADIGRQWAKDMGSNYVNLLTAPYTMGKKVVGGIADALSTGNARQRAADARRFGYFPPNLSPTTTAFEAQANVAPTDTTTPPTGATATQPYVQPPAAPGILQGTATDMAPGFRYDPSTMSTDELRQTIAFAQQNNAPEMAAALGSELNKRVGGLGGTQAAADAAKTTPLTLPTYTPDALPELSKIPDFQDFLDQQKQARDAARDPAAEKRLSELESQLKDFRGDKDKAQGLNTGVILLKAAQALGQPGKSTVTAFANAFGVVGDEALKMAQLDQEAKKQEFAMRVALEGHREALNSRQDAAAARNYAAFQQARTERDHRIVDMYNMQQTAKYRNAALGIEGQKVGLLAQELPSKIASNMAGAYEKGQLGTYYGTTRQLQMAQTQLAAYDKMYQAAAEKHVQANGLAALSPGYDEAVAAYKQKLREQDPNYQRLAAQVGIPVMTRPSGVPIYEDPTGATGIGVPPAVRARP